MMMNSSHPLSLSSFFTIQFNSTNSHHNLIKSPLKLSPFFFLYITPSLHSLPHQQPLLFLLLRLSLSLSLSLVVVVLVVFVSGNQSIKMNRRNGPKIDLKLNLSAPSRPNVESPNQSPSTASPTSSCVSSDDSSVRYSPEGKSMMLVGCPRCLMYVMLAEEDPKCPKCKSTVLLDVVHDENNNNKNKNKKN